MKDTYQSPGCLPCGFHIDFRDCRWCAHLQHSTQLRAQVNFAAGWRISQRCFSGWPWLGQNQWWERIWQVKFSRNSLFTESYHIIPWFWIGWNLHAHLRLNSKVWLLKARPNPVSCFSIPKRWEPSASKPVATNIYRISHRTVWWPKYAKIHQNPKTLKVNESQTSNFWICLWYLQDLSCFSNSQLLF